MEVYDLTPGASSSLGNISTRSFVQTGEHVMIGGFIVQGTRRKSVIIGVPLALSSPSLGSTDPLPGSETGSSQREPER